MFKPSKSVKTRVSEEVSNEPYSAKPPTSTEMKVNRRCLLCNKIEHIAKDCKTYGVKKRSHRDRKNS